MKHFKYFLIISLVVFLTGAGILAYLVKHDGDGWPKEGECGGSVYIYVNDINKSLPLLKENFIKNNWQITFENKQDKNITKLIIKFPYNQVQVFDSIVTKQSSDKIVYGAKVLYEVPQEDCQVYIANLQITDVKALK